MDYIENRTFDEIRVGDSATVIRKLTGEDILLFAAVSGDVNPAHVDEEFARSDLFHKVIAHGMWGAALISTVLGTELPGPGTIYLGQTLSFRRPVTIGDIITVTVRACERNEEKKRVTFDCQCVNQRGETVISGTADVLAPREKVRRPKMRLPEVRVFDRFARYRALLLRVEGCAPLRAGIVHPTDRASMEAVADALKHDLIVPTLIGPEARVRAAASAANLDLGGIEIESVEHSHAAADRAVELARAGELDVLLQGALSKEELMNAVTAPGNGLHTARRMTHVYVLDVPTFARPLLLTDAMLSVEPQLDEKRDIVQNAIELARAIGIDQPKVALLTGSEKVDARCASTLDAAALCKMAERGQITGGMLDGPIPLDAAVSAPAAAHHGIASVVGGNADVLVVPEMESGQMLVRQLQYLSEAHTAGLVMGARVPIILTSPEDTIRTRVAGFALANLLVRFRGKVEQATAIKSAAQ